MTSSDVTASVSSTGRASAAVSGHGRLRPWRGCWLLAQTAGLLGGVILIGGCAPRQSRAEREVLGRWLGASEIGNLGVRPVYAVVGGVLLLTSGWLGVVAVLTLGPVRRARWVLASCVAWSAPFAVAVPIFSHDAYAYVAQGQLLVEGHDPYVASVSALGPHSGVLAAVDPVWRHTLTPYGPLALRIEQLAAIVGSGHEWRALVMLRLVAVIAVAVTGWCVWAMTSPPHRALALWLTLSPLTLVHLIAGEHLDALVCALLAGAVLAVSRGRFHTAALLIVVAGNVKVTAAVLLLALLVHTCLLHGRRAMLRNMLAAAGAQALAAATFPTDPLGWLRALSTPGGAWDPFTPSSMAAAACNELAMRLGAADQPWLVSLCRLVAGLLGLIAAVLILRGARHREFPLTCAFLVLDAALCGPALWPWYLNACIVLLVMSRSRAAWALAVLISAAGGLLGLPLSNADAQRVAMAAELAVLVTAAAFLAATLGGSDRCQRLKTGLR